MAVKPFPGLVVGSPGCCADGPCCNGAARLRSTPRLGEAVEDLAVEQFVAQRPVEALIIAILPW